MRRETQPSAITCCIADSVRYPYIQYTLWRSVTYLWKRHVIKNKRKKTKPRLSVNTPHFKVFPKDGAS